jgi:hypothetical protein
VLTDTRGPFTAMILRSGSASATCFDGPSFTTVAANDTQSGGGSEHVLSAGSATGGAQGSVSVMGFDGCTSGGPLGPATQSHLTMKDGQPYTFVQGQVSAGATGVTLTRSDGSNVQATVGDGAFVVWWPGTADATSAYVVGPSGGTTQQLTFTPAPPPRPAVPLAARGCTKGTSRVP